LEKSATAERLEINNKAPPAYSASLQKLIDKVISPIQQHYGIDVVVTSGFRSTQLNRAVKGANVSQHCLGEALDLEVPGIPNDQLAQWVFDSIPETDQVILEFFVPGIPDSGWVHVSMTDRHPPRRMLLLAEMQDNGRVRYVRLK
jgi:hypothetical protein